VTFPAPKHSAHSHTAISWHSTELVSKLFDTPTQYCMLSKAVVTKQQTFENFSYSKWQFRGSVPISDCFLWPLFLHLRHLPSWL